MWALFQTRYHPVLAVNLENPVQKRGMHDSPDRGSGSDSGLRGATTRVRPYEYGLILRFRGCRAETKIRNVQDVSQKQKIAEVSAY